MTTIKSQPAAALTAFEAHTFTSSGDHLLPYRILWPKGYSEAVDSDRFPVVLFLHGAGERGDDNQLQLTHGTPLFLDAQANFPAIVIMPQCSVDDYWAQMALAPDGQREFDFRESANKNLAAATELLDQLLKQEKADLDRVYLMGLSMGGMGTLELLARRPNTFAAAVPICGGTNPALTGLYAQKVPLWIFHGDADQVVDVGNSRRVVAALQAQAVDCRYTEYSGVGHDSWTAAFAETDLLPWIFSKKRTN